MLWERRGLIDLIQGGSGVRGVRVGLLLFIEEGGGEEEEEGRLGKGGVDVEGQFVS